MRVLVIGTGGVGVSAATIAKRRDPKGDWLQLCVMADYNLERAERFSKQLGNGRFPAESVNAEDVDHIAALADRYDVDLIFNAVAPSFNQAVLQAALKAETDYMDTAMTLSRPHPSDPFNKCGVKLGEEEFSLSPEFDRIGRLAMAGCGVEPGMADFFARYGADHFFDEVEEIGIRDGSNLEIPGFNGITFGFSIWTTIEECTNPAIVWDAREGWHTVVPFSETEPFWLPEGIGTVQVAHVEHEEVICVGRAASLLKGVKRATFKYALGDEFTNAMAVFKAVNMDSKTKIQVGDCMVAPRDVVAAAAPDPLEIGKRYVGKTAAGTWIRGKKGGMTREVYLYQVADSQECVEKYDQQVVQAQTAFTPVIVWELMAAGRWAGYKGNPESGVHVPEEFDADDYVALMPAYEFPGGLLEMESEYKIAHDRAGLQAPASAGDRLR
ncbi:MAG TPA: saccharopine dehydrogenase C-terminal domain-containing protein [Thermoleophilia bacterium]|nr:saccharopine dehydrogenase C-terminal domain-containing protein [Thermoleophilia bacterium]